jgi:hypothetical protein
MAQNKNQKKKDKGDQWPKREKLIEALEIFQNFRDMCQFQMELGYWATMDFPTKHHLNKILSIQYMDKKMLEEVYGKVLVKRTFDMMPYCKSYISFVKMVKKGNHANKKQNRNSSAKTSSKN